MWGPHARGRVAALLAEDGLGILLQRSIVCAAGGNNVSIERYYCGEHEGMRGCDAETGRIVW
jgi:hypothetical protein